MSTELKKKNDARYMTNINWALASELSTILCNMKWTIRGGMQQLTYTYGDVSLECDEQKGLN
jgi:hypothetical protein